MHRCLASVIFALAVGATIWAPGARSGNQRRTSVHDNDSSSQKELSEAVEKFVKEQQQHVRRLIAIAKDRKRRPRERRLAILQLAKSRTQQALQFLIENSQMQVPKFIITTDADGQLLRPCLAALHDGDWAVGQSIIAAMGRQWSKVELADFGYVVTHIFGPYLAFMIIDHELKKSLSLSRNGDGKTTATRVTNLKTLRSIAAKRYFRHDVPLRFRLAPPHD